MLFGRGLPLSSVIDLCRALRHNLGAGLTLVQVFRQQAERGPHGVRALAGRLLDHVSQGESLSRALDEEKDALPPLFVSLAKVGEESGHLPEIFGELERFFLLQQKLRREFRSQSMMPIIQLFLGFFIIAGLIFVLGMIASARGGNPMTLFGLSGPTGALLFLMFSFGSIFMLWFMYQMFRSNTRHVASFDAFLLRVPALGPCLEALVLHRFCLALQLTLETGMPIMRALRLSLEATGNAAYARQTPVVTQALKAGEPLIEALTRTGLFPVDFLGIVATGEEGGRVPEVLRHQAEYYHEEAERRMKTLTRLAGLLVWMIYAAFMVVMIFRIASMYLGALGG